MTESDIKPHLKTILHALSEKHGKEVGIKITKKDSLVYSSYDGKVIKEENIDDLLEPVISAIVKTLSPLQKFSAPLFIGAHKQTLKDTLLKIFTIEANNNLIPESSFAVLIHDKENPEMKSLNGVECLGAIQLNKHFN